MELVKGNCIGSQSELAERLAQQGINVTQATLSRDLKALKITKVASDRGGYMYIFPGTTELQWGSTWATPRLSFRATSR